MLSKIKDLVVLHVNKFWNLMKGSGSTTRGAVKTGALVFGLVLLGVKFGIVALLAAVAMLVFALV